mgnify:CR=1 FL=1
MVKTYFDTAGIKDSRREVERVPPAVQVIAGYNAYENGLLHEWIRHLAHQRACGDAHSAVNGFIAICILVVIAVGFLVAL